MVRLPGVAVLLLGVVVLLALTGCGAGAATGTSSARGSSPTAASASGTQPPATGAPTATGAITATGALTAATTRAVPEPAHTVVVVMENHAYAQIIGSPDAPFISSLARRGELFTRSYAITHPSEPNYLPSPRSSTRTSA